MGQKMSFGKQFVLETFVLGEWERNQEMRNDEKTGLVLLHV